jgi:hypothetical protein
MQQSMNEQRLPIAARATITIAFDSLTGGLFNVEVYAFPSSIKYDPCFKVQNQSAVPISDEKHAILRCKEFEKA